MNENEKDAYQAVADEIDTVCTDTTSHALVVLLALPKFQLLLELFRLSNRGMMAVFWHSYIDLVCLLLRFTRETREGIWSLHMCCIPEMLPWFLAYDGTNYARNLSVYWCEMTLLPRTHPHVTAVFESGQFAVMRSSNSTFCSSTRGPDDRTNHEQGLQDKGRHRWHQSQPRCSTTLDPDRSRQSQYLANLPRNDRSLS